jgi:putative membrane protein insertion efficiency factor
VRHRPGLAARAALALIRAYKYVISPWLTGGCRFVPTCADYTAEAIARHGLLRGGWLGVRRLSRCQPFGGSGHDPVPVE